MCASNSTPVQGSLFPEDDAINGQLSGDREGEHVAHVSVEPKEDFDDELLPWGQERKG